MYEFCAKMYLRLSLSAMSMLHHRGVERWSVLVGSSVHNQRIEHLWKDSHRCVTLMFYRLFYYLEQNNLNPITEEHLFAIHCAPS